MNNLKTNKRLFSLLEVMVAMVLLTMASGVIGWNMYQAVQKKQFQSELERLRAQFTACQKLAVASQADWQGVFKKKKGEWVFEAKSEDETRFPPLHLHEISILLNGKQVDQLVVNFFSSGKVLPEGKVKFSRNESRVEWEISEIFQRGEGQKLGPLHPNYSN